MGHSLQLPPPRHDRISDGAVRLQLDGTLLSARPGPVSNQPWWHAARESIAAIEAQPSEPGASVCYRFGDAVLQIDSHAPKLLEKFALLYGDCEVQEPAAPDRPLVRCVVRRGGEPPLLLLTFLEGGPRDPASAFLPMRDTRVWDSPIPGLRLAGTETVPILAACGAQVLINLRQAWEHYPVEYLVTATLTAQPGLLAVHSASLAMHDAGFLLAGPSGSGKTTTSLHLAARGHGLLGDEVALIRLATSEIVPFRRSANLRPGPRSPALARALGRLPKGHHCKNDEDQAPPLPLGSLFPGAQAKPAPLRAAFFLAGFADKPSVAPFRPTLQDLDAFGVLAGNEIATLWGLPPQRRALRLLAASRLLERLQCWKLVVGGPVETAELIERKMGSLKC